MATTTYIEDLTLAGVNAAFTLLSDALVAKAWPRTVINATATQPVNADQSAREEIFQAPGDAVDIGGFFIGLRTYREGNNTRNAIMLYAFTAIGEGGFVAITTLSRSGTTVTATTAAPHLMSTGDIVVVNGTDNIILNECNSGTGAIHVTITVTGGSTFTYVSNTSGAEAATGGTCFAVFNLTGPINGTINDPFRINIDDAACDLVGAVDEFGITGDLIQAGNFRYFYCGAVGRGHIPATMSQTLTSVGAIVATGALQTIATNETPNDLFVGQPIDFVDSISGRVFRTRLDVIGPGDAIQCILAVGQDFGASCVIGWDPMPLFTTGAQGVTLTTQTMLALRWDCAYGINGTRAWAQTDPDDAESTYNLTEPRVTAGEEGVQDSGVANLGTLASYDIILTRSTGAPADQQGARGPLRNQVGVLINTEVDFDFGQAGKNVPGDIYKHFTTQQVTAALDHVAFGPNVPGAPALP